MFELKLQGHFCPILSFMNKEKYPVIFFWFFFIGLNRGRHECYGDVMLERVLLNLSSSAVRPLLHRRHAGDGRAARVPRADVGHLPLQRGPHAPPGLRHAQARRGLQGKHVTTLQSDHASSSNIMQNMYQNLLHDYQCHGVSV